MVDFLYERLHDELECHRLLKIDNVTLLTTMTINHTADCWILSLYYWSIDRRFRILYSIFVFRHDTVILQLSIIHAQTL
jgi:hypothetical protein